MTRKERIEKQMQKTKVQMRELRKLLDANTETELELAYELQKLLLKMATIKIKEEQEA